MMKPFALAFLLCFTATQAFATEPPNILMIMVDDLGFSDLGCYGSEIATPNLDALAKGGVQFSQFYNTAKCHSSRVSLLSGQYCIAAGDTSLQHAVTSAEVLQKGGYYTAMTGKWHLKQEPTDFGFQRYFGHLSGACNYFTGDKTFRLDGQPWTVPKQGFYTTVANVDYGIQFLKETPKAKTPWYLYIAFNAPHAPLHALKEDYAKYAGRYDKGWDVIREARILKQQQLGLLPEGTAPSPRPDHIPAWDSLQKPRQEFEINRMRTLAAMIDRVDQEIGRMVQNLKDTDQFENTLIWFVSDNGACPYDRRSNNLDKEPTDGSVNWSDSTGWAWARNSPFRFYKQNQYEGGICTPAIVHWPRGITVPAGSIIREPAHLIDILPTIADVSGAEIPTEFKDRELRPVSGNSLKPLFKGEQVSRPEPLHFLFASDRGLRDGDWKIASFRSGPWELFNLKEDRTELNNVAAQHPERLHAMVDRWTAMGRDVLHAKSNSIKPVNRDRTGYHHPEWTNFAKDSDDAITGSSKPKRSKSNRNINAIRARKNTTLKIKGGELILTMTGEDPGLAFDQLSNDLQAGPYQLRFELNSNADSAGEVFFTTDDQTTLPKGQHITYTVNADEGWHTHCLKLNTSKQLKKLRLDVSGGAGTAGIRNLQLLTKDGDALLSWPIR